MTLPGDKNKKEGGLYWEYVPKEAKAGTIIAYLIREDDKNLQHPIGRMLIRAYVNDHEDFYMVACTGGYGTVPEDMVKQVKTFTEKMNKEAKYGYYMRPRDIEGTYSPDISVDYLPDNLEDLVRKNKLKIITDLKGILESKFRKFIYSESFGGKNEYYHTNEYLYDMKKIRRDFTIDDILPLLKTNKQSAEAVVRKIRMTTRKDDDHSFELAAFTQILWLVNFVTKAVIEKIGEPDLRSMAAFERWNSNIVKDNLKVIFKNKYKDFFVLLKKYYPIFREILKGK
jgi:uncharacterized protein YehS (DUF1456 family)